MRIMIADDSSIVRRVLRRALEECGVVEIDEFKDGTSMAEALRTNDYDIVFSDVYMPGMSGLEAISMAHHQGGSFFTVFMSTDMSPEIVDVAKSMGAFEFLAKPFQPREVATILSCYKRMRSAMRVLLVDDSHTVRRVVERVFQRSRFQMTLDEAGDGPSAIALCRENAYKIIFLDVNMPEMDGFATLAEIRKSQPKASVVLISGEKKGNILIRAGGFDVDAFLAKPFLPQDVDMLLYRLLGLNAPQLAVKRAIESAAARA